MENAAVIVCTRDRPAELERCVDSVLAQTVRPTVVVVVDSSHADTSEVMLRRYQTLAESRIIYVRSSPGLPIQRNVGLSAIDATVGLIGFLDDDVVLEEDYLAEVTEAFGRSENTEVLGMCGNAVNEVKRHMFDRFIRQMFFITANSTGKLLISGDAGHIFSPQRDSDVEVLSGCNMWFRARVFTEVGLRFDENLTDYAYMEDQDFSIRVRKYGCLRQLKSAKLLHAVSDNSRLQEDKLFHMYIVNSFYLLRKNLSPGIREYLAYGWRLVGKLVHAAAKSLTDFTMLPLKGWFTGILSINMKARLLNHE